MVPVTSNSAVSKAHKIALKVDVGLEEETETVTEYTAGYTIVHSKISMWGKFLNQSIGKLHRKN